jgi:hypothetical protein
MAGMGAPNHSGYSTKSLPQHFQRFLRPLRKIFLELGEQVGFGSKLITALTVYHQVRNL